MYLYLSRKAAVESWVRCLYPGTYLVNFTPSLYLESRIHCLSCFLVNNRFLLHNHSYKVWHRSKLPCSLQNQWSNYNIIIHINDTLQAMWRPTFKESCLSPRDHCVPTLQGLAAQTCARKRASQSMRAAACCLVPWVNILARPRNKPIRRLLLCVGVIGILTTCN